MIRVDSCMRSQCNKNFEFSIDLIGLNRQFRSKKCVYLRTIFTFSGILLVTLLGILTISVPTWAQINPMSSNMSTSANDTAVATLSGQGIVIKNTDRGSEAKGEGRDISLDFKEASTPEQEEISGGDEGQSESESESESDIRTLLDEADSLYNIGEYDGAISYDDKVLSIEQDNIYALNSKVAALVNIGKNEEAIYYADRVLEIDPDDTDALANKGLALYNLDRNEDAITYYDQVLEIDPDDTTTLTNKGVALHFLERNEEAISYYDEVLDIDPSNTVVLNNKGARFLHWAGTRRPLSTLIKYWQ